MARLDEEDAEDAAGKDDAREGSSEPRRVSGRFVWR